MGRLESGMPRLTTGLRGAVAWRQREGDVMRAIVRGVGFILMLALAGAACSGGKEAGTGGAPSSGSAPARQELTVGFGEDQYILEGPRTNLGMYPLNTNVVQGLTYLTAKYEVQPLLAERWEFRAPNTWRFFLRRGVKFHDGQPLNAQAVKQGLFDRVAKIPGGGTIKAGPDSAVVVDELTIDFTPTVPNFRVPEQIVHPINGAVAPGSDLSKKPVGTGPFRFVEYAPKQRIIVERNPDYWGDAAKLDKITFRFLPDSNTRRLALESGEVDLAYEVPRQDAKGLESKGFQVMKSPVGAYEAMYANIHGKPGFDLLTDPALRKAIAYGIDRKKLVSGVLDDLATTDVTWVPPTTLEPYASLIKGYTYDAAKAKSLLEEAGWKPGSDGIRTKGGRRLKLTLVSGFPSAEVHRPIPTFLQAQLKDIGIDVEIVERPDSASYEPVINSGDGDLFLEQGNQNDANPGFLPILLLYGPNAGGAVNYQGLFAPGARFDELLAPSLTEVDPTKVRKAVAEAMREAVDEQAVIIQLAGIFRIYGMKKSVQGFVPHPSFLNVRWDGVSVGR